MKGPALGGRALDHLDGGHVLLQLLLEDGVLAADVGRLLVGREQLLLQPLHLQLQPVHLRLQPRLPPKSVALGRCRRLSDRLRHFIVVF